MPMKIEFTGYIQIVPVELPGPDGQPVDGKAIILMDPATQQQIVYAMHDDLARQQGRKLTQSCKALQGTIEKEFAEAEEEAQRQAARDKLLGGVPGPNGGPQG